MDERGVPLSLDVTGANVHDVKNIGALVYGSVIPQPDDIERNLCLDNGYTGQKAKLTVEDAGYIPHVRGRSSEQEGKILHPEYKPRRWIVEVSHSWFNRFRKLLVRFEKKACTHIALSHLAAAIIAFRKAKFIYE